MEKCWNLGFIPIWNETRFCSIKILHKMKWLFIAQLYWLMQTVCNREEPAKWVFQSEFPGLSLPRRQFSAKLMAAVLQGDGGKADQAQHRHNVTRCLGAAADVTASQDRSVCMLHLPFLVLLTCLGPGGSLFLVDTGTATWLSWLRGVHTAGSKPTAGVSWAHQ